MADLVEEDNIPTSEHIIFDDRYLLGSKWSDMRLRESPAGGAHVVHIFPGTDLKYRHHRTIKKDVVIKIEDTETVEDHCSELLKEKIVFTEGEIGIPNLKWFGVRFGKRALVIQKLGPTLKQRFENFQPFTTKTVLMIADQMLERLEYLHSRGFIHRNLSPESFAFGRSEKDCDTVYLTEYGKSAKFRDHDGIHLPEDAKDLISSPEPECRHFASLNAQQGKPQSRRDDLTSLGYLLIYFLRGGLPWQSLRTRNCEEAMIDQKRSSAFIHRLCDGFPQEFIDFLQYCRDLTFEEAPDYFKLRQSFRDLFLNMDFDLDFIYDWKIIPE